MCNGEGSCTAGTNSTDAPAPPRGHSDRKISRSDHSPVVRGRTWPEAELRSSSGDKAHRPLASSSVTTSPAAMFDSPALSALPPILCALAKQSWVIATCATGNRHRSGWTQRPGSSQASRSTPFFVSAYRRVMDGERVSACLSPRWFGALRAEPETITWLGETHETRLGRSRSRHLA